MTNEQLKKLVSEIEERFPSYRGWNFGVEGMTGCISYSKSDKWNQNKWIDCYFTPEWNENGVIAVHVIDQDAQTIEDFQANVSFDNTKYDVHEIVSAAFRMIDRIELPVY